MTAAEALDAANDAEPRANDSDGSSHDAARAERVAQSRSNSIPAGGRFARNCLTVYDDYGKAVNEIVEWRILH